MENQRTEENQEKVILVAIAGQGQLDETEQSLEELEELAKTAGAKTTRKIIQARESVHPGTYVGTGKIDEIREALEETGSQGIITDDELSPAQMKNLEKALNAKIMDRSLLILDIFARHAHTKEGIIQVEMAQLKYRISRLAGLGTTLSRLGGGIGTRGPGEKKLETDRRHIERRISQLRKELEDVKRHRLMLRENRERQNKPVVAIAGYTNAGKSTLLNHLTQAGVLEENKLFATLDPTTRAYVTPEGKEILLTDTVGFIHKLPHHLVEAFQSTLEEVAFADLIIHVVDGSNPSYEKHMHVVSQTLADLGAIDKPMITVFNKKDAFEDHGPLIKDNYAFKVMAISAKNNEGLDELVMAIEEKLNEGLIHIRSKLAYDQAPIVQKVRQYGQLLEERFEADGIYIEAYLEKAYVDKFGLQNNS